MPDSFYVTPLSPLLAQGVDCIYCHTNIVLNDHVIVCSSCQSPHHVDCWELNSSQCATFGCDNIGIVDVSAVDVSSMPLVTRRIPALPPPSASSSTVADRTRKMETKLREILGVAALYAFMLLFFLFMLVAIVLDPRDSSTRSMAEDTQVENVEMIGTQLGDINYELLGVTNESRGLVGMRARGSFISVRLWVENSGATPRAYTGFELIDDRQRIYEPVANTVPHVAEDEECNRLTLEPNARRICAAVYDVYGGAKSVSIILTNLDPVNEQQEFVPLVGALD